jgi:hypothetical protein
MKTSPLTMEGYKAYARRLGPLSTEGSLSCDTCYGTGPRFFRFHPKDHPTWLPITTHMKMWNIYSNRILTCLHSVASQGDEGDLFSPGPSRVSGIEGSRQQTVWWSKSLLHVMNFFIRLSKDGTYYVMALSVRPAGWLAVWGHLQFFGFFWVIFATWYIVL